MVVGLEPLVVVWTRWGIHFMVVASFTVQVTLLLLSDIRRRRDWALLKGVIWLAYTLAETTAVYALGHMSVVCMSPEHQLLALWAPLLLVHLGGQDNITAYAIEDNRLWLRHLQTFVLQVAAAGYVLYVSSILSHSSKLRSAAILMFLVGVLKYGERIWALRCADTCASSNLSATSYDKAASFSLSTTEYNKVARAKNRRNEHLIAAYLLLDVPKQMFEGPTTYVQISDRHHMVHGWKAKDSLRVVGMQLSMMYDLLYTKAAVVHTWYGLCSRVLISLPFTIAALALFCSSSLAAYKRADVQVTNVLLVGAVILETVSVLRAIFSLLYGRGWNTIGNMVLSVTGAMERLVGCRSYFGGCLFKLACHSGSSIGIAMAETIGMEDWLILADRMGMGQHNLFRLADHSDNIGSKMAKRMGVEDWWNSNVYSWSAEVPKLAIVKVLEQVPHSKGIMESQGLNDLPLRRNMHNQLVAAWIWTEEGFTLEERILAWHIATHVYNCWWRQYPVTTTWWDVEESIEALADYMFFLLAARPYMLPYPVSRRAYVQLCSDAVSLGLCSKSKLVDAVLNQKEALLEGTPLQPASGVAHSPLDWAIGPRPSMNNILDRGCQLAAKLIHITATPPKHNEDIITGQAPQTFSFNREVLHKLEYSEVLNMVLEVWAEMLCHTAYLCNENYHAKHLIDGGELITTISLLMIYMKNHWSDIILQGV